MHRRVYRRVVGKGKPPSPYRSWFEYDLHRGPLKGLEYEPEKIPYTIATTYTPDFVNRAKGIILEAKGRFEDASEAAKYIHFRESNPDWTLIFVFANPRTPMPNSRRRKDGTRFSHGDWATKNGFEFCSPNTVKEEWL